MLVVAVKFVPVTVNVNWLEPAAIVVGLIDVIAGTTAAEPPPVVVDAEFEGEEEQPVIKVKAETKIPMEREGRKKIFIEARIYVICRRKTTVLRESSETLESTHEVQPDDSSMPSSNLIARPKSYAFATQVLRI